ncbi:EH domain-binding protein 1 [Aphelenchoides besseyi]|nr:EH domain-binding protein 1 [Aphelenchoides besseyi]KAI6200141.1 EH domain-binding protein 1 [Aphelenchoides besseyi]
MSLLLRKFKRSKKKAAKFRFNLSCKELIFELAPKWRPERIVIACMHRKRRYEITPRRLEWSLESYTRAMIAWPDECADPLLMTTTLFRDQDHDQYDDKDWTLVVEEVTAKGKHRPLAAISINVRLFITDLPGTRMEAKFKLRPLRKEVQLCTLQLDISSKLLREGETAEDDLQSLASSVSNLAIDKPAEMVESDGNAVESKTDKEVVNGIAKVSDEIVKFTEAVSTPEEEPSSVAISDKPKTPKESKQPSLHIEEEKKEDPIDVPLSPPVEVHYRDTLSKKTSQPSIPAVIPGEPLIEWCSRITKGYKNTTVRDFTKSFKSGLAFCAIIHRYRPDLIGDFSSLDFADTLGACKSNCKKAFAAAEELGVRSTLDESIVTLLDRAQIQRFLDMLRYVLEGGSISNGSDSNRHSSQNNHRTSSIYGLSEGEVTLLSDFELMKQSRLQESELESSAFGMTLDETDDGILKHSTPRNPPHSRQHTGQASPQLGRKKYDNDRIAESFRNEPSPIPKQSLPNVASLVDDVKSLNFTKHPKREFDVDSDERREQLRLKARQMLENPAAAVVDSELDEERKKRLHAEAQNLLSNISTHTPVSELPQFNPLRRTSSVRSTNSVGSNTDLRTLDVITTQTSFRTFKKLQPSPQLQRKTYEGPILPAYGRVPQSQMNGGNNKSFNRTQSPSAVYGNSAFDRVKRFGSMRSQELAETLSQILTRPEFDKQTANSTNAIINSTPSRKAYSRLEKEQRTNSVDASIELDKISARLNDIEKLDADVLAKISSVTPGSSDEQELMMEHLKLLNERNELVSRQDDINKKLDY